MTHARPATRRVLPLAVLAVLAVLPLAAVLPVPVSANTGQQSINSLVSDARSELERMNEFGKLESQSRQMLKDGRFAEARRVAMRAMELNVSNRRAKLLLADIDAAEAAAAPATTARGDAPGGRPGRVPAGRAESAIASPGRADRARGPGEVGNRGTQSLREVVRAYLSGDYASALSASAAAGESAPPRVWLYAACSEAALGLLDASTAEAHFARARELYAKAQASGQPFTTDRRVISPRVWDVIATP